ncbi:MAG: hypothetical protein F6K21_36975, partial [Symploca sp. SIO2D2]|nr:hypothetical protein [Symploca sp. SIO2D2]
EWGMLHADPNPGNYRFYRENGRPVIGLIDFGCIKKVDTDFRAQIANTIFHLKSRIPNSTQALEAFESLGFKADLIAPLADKLPQVIEILRAPFLVPGNFDTREWQLSSRLKETLGNSKMNFRMAGPSNLLFILRSFQGLTQFLNALKVPVDWREILDRTKTLNTNPEQTIANKPSELKSRANPPAAETLNIHVEENGVLKARLSFDSKATDNLVDLMPLDIRRRIDAREHDLQGIVQRARLSNYAPGELFNFTSGQKTVKVWLD